MYFFKDHITIKKEGGKDMLYRKIKGIRSDLGLTQKEMANYLGISIRAYRNKEKGEAPFNQIEMILIMEKANMTPEEAGALFFNKESNLELYKYFLTDLLYK